MQKGPTTTINPAFLLSCLMLKQPIQFLNLESQIVSFVMKNGRKLKSVFLFAGGHDYFSLPP